MEALGTSTVVGAIAAIALGTAFHLFANTNTAPKPEAAYVHQTNMQATHQHQHSSCATTNNQ